MLRILAGWNKALDNDEYLAAILIYLSKDIDFLQHDLLLLKLKSNGLSKSALRLLNSYLSNRNQCVRIGQSVAEMLTIYKGVPQGSILVLFFSMSLSMIVFFLQ